MSRYRVVKYTGLGQGRQIYKLAMRPLLEALLETTPLSQKKEAWFTVYFGKRIIKIIIVLIKTRLQHVATDMGIEEDKVMEFPGEQDNKLSNQEASPLITNRGSNIDEALDKVGIGLFHVILILVTGWALASDSVEILCIGFVSPQLTDIHANPDLALKPSSVHTHTHTHTHTTPTHTHTHTHTVDTHTPHTHTIPTHTTPHTHTHTHYTHSTHTHTHTHTLHTHTTHTHTHSTHTPHTHTHTHTTHTHTQVEEGVLDGVIFAGMMVGGYVWGSISDIVGRRSCLITSLIFNGVFGFASSLSPHYIAFLFFRFMSGVG